MSNLAMAYAMRKRAGKKLDTTNEKLHPMHEPAAMEPEMRELEAMAKGGVVASIMARRMNKMAAGGEVTEFASNDDKIEDVDTDPAETIQDNETLANPEEHLEGPDYEDPKAKRRAMISKIVYGK